MFSSVFGHESDACFIITHYKLRYYRIVRAPISRICRPVSGEKEKKNFQIGFSYDFSRPTTSSRANSHRIDRRSLKVRYILLCTIFIKFFAGVFLFGVFSRSTVQCEIPPPPHIPFAIEEPGYILFLFYPKTETYARFYLLLFFFSHHMAFLLGVPPLTNIKANPSCFSSDSSRLIGRKTALTSRSFLYIYIY